MNFSKSRYCGLWQCPKLCWLKQYKPEELKIDAGVEARFATGTDVGDLAMGLFGQYTDVTVAKPDGSLNISAMITKTKKLLDDSAENICEASFSFNGLFCAVDILHKEKDGYAIYEVKSSTSVHYIYAVDVAFQKYVLEKCGIKVTGTYVVNIDSDYERNGELDIKKLFKITDISSLVKDEEEIIEENLKYAEELLSKDTEPNLDIDMHCTIPYNCGFWDYCTKHIPKPSVFDVYRLSFKNALQTYKKGIVSFKDLRNSNLKISEIQKRQLDFSIEEREPYIDREKIKEFLDELTYPLYFLDFETMQLVVPGFDRSHPYDQITFQYSLHYIGSENGELKHKEFLGVSGEDPRRALAESLCHDIPDNVCVLAYNKAFECTRIEELASLFPDLREHLLKIRFNIKDLLVPFQRGYYYNRAMGGSFSIKSVLPALFPDDPSLNYHNLEGIHNGAEAMAIFPKIKDMPPEEAEKARHDLLKYCELDTYAMVKLWQELKRVTNGCIG